jgi:hypothetical protein
VSKNLVYHNWGKLTPNAKGLLPKTSYFNCCHVLARPFFAFPRLFFVGIFWVIKGLFSFPASMANAYEYAVSFGGTVGIHCNVCKKISKSPFGRTASKQSKFPAI